MSNHTVSLDEALLEKAKEIYAQGGFKDSRGRSESFNLSAFIDQQLEIFINSHAQVEMITCLDCGARFSNKVWTKFTHNKDTCINCGAGNDRLNRVKEGEDVE